MKYFNEILSNIKLTIFTDNFFFFVKYSIYLKEKENADWKGWIITQTPFMYYALLTCKQNALY